MLSRLHEALLPRFVKLEFTFKGRRICWFFPLCALEESLNVGVRALTLYWRYRQGPRPDWIDGVNLLCGPQESLLRLARGECLIDIETSDTHIKISQF